MSVVSAARKYNSLQTQIIKLIPDAAEVQTAGWNNDGHSDDSGAKTGYPAVAPVPNLNHQKVIINFSAMMAYLRLYQMPDETTPQESAVSAFLMQEDSAQCVCCGHAASVDEVGFCDACMTVAEPT